MAAQETLRRRAIAKGWEVLAGRLISPDGEHFPLDVDWMGDRKPALKERLDATDARLREATKLLREWVYGKDDLHLSRFYERARKFVDEAEA